jgi:hypothetical protein
MDPCAQPQGIRDEIIGFLALGLGLGSRGSRDGAAQKSRNFNGIIAESDYESATRWSQHSQPSARCHVTRSRSTKCHETVVGAGTEPPIRRNRPTCSTIAALDHGFHLFARIVSGGASRQIRHMSQSRRLRRVRFDSERFAKVLRQVLLRASQSADRSLGRRRACIRDCCDFILSRASVIPGIEAPITDRL